MAKREPIKTVTYIRVGGELVCTDSLNTEQKKYIATLLKVQYMNALYAGRAVFEPEAPLPPKEEVFPQLKEQAAV